MILAEIALLRISKDETIPLVEVLVKLTEQEELIRKLQDQLSRR